VSYAIQLARNAGLDVVATASSKDVEYVRALGAQTVVDFQQVRFEDVVTAVDVVLDTVGGETHERSFKVMKPSGILVSVVSSPSPKEAAGANRARSIFFFVDVTTDRLTAITELFDSGKLVAHVGAVLALGDARIAHEMLAGADHARGKIVLNVAANSTNQT